MVPKRFALIGAAGFVARRHLEAIQHVGGELVAALDPHDSVGLLDSFFPDCRFFTVPERFDRFLNREDAQIDYVVICSPNWLHDTHCRWALRAGSHVICEKPLVLNPWNVVQLHQLEQETDRRVHPILQLRCHPQIVDLKNRVAAEAKPLNLELVYTTRRGRWYMQSWKGDQEKSGGVLMNLGIHLFDALCFIFGEPPMASQDVELDDHSGSGRLSFGASSVSWRLSMKAEDLSHGTVAKGGYADRYIRDVDSGEVLADFSGGQSYTSLHNRVYSRIMTGQWLTAMDALPAIQLVSEIRGCAPRSA